jgi:hypothetical protein
MAFALTGTNSITDPIYVLVGQTITPFNAAGVSFTDVNPSSIPEIVSVKSASNKYVPGSIVQTYGIGVLTDLTPSPDIFATVGGTTLAPATATSLNEAANIRNPITLSGPIAASPVPTSSGPFYIFVDVVTPPAITGAIANEPVAAGQIIAPFATVTLTDNNYTATATPSMNRSPPIPRRSSSPTAAHKPTAMVC